MQSFRHCIGSTVPSDYHDFSTDSTWSSPSSGLKMRTIDGSQTRKEGAKLPATVYGTHRLSASFDPEGGKLHVESVEKSREPLAHRTPCAEGGYVKPYGDCKKHRRASLHERAHMHHGR